jgi:hypothetical protein
MQNFKERRHLERFSIPGATTLYRLDRKIGFLNRYTGPTRLKDITKHGACIEIKENIVTGSVLNIKIIVPGEEKISIRGQIVWNNHSAERPAAEAGIQFLPYGKGKPYNSFKTREILERLTRQYLDVQTPNEE